MTTALKSRPKAGKLSGWAAQVDAALAKALPSVGQGPPMRAEAMRYCLFPGGKRYRPLLTLAACEAVGASARHAMAAACAVELIHTYSLVHDDLPAMDNADERRGQASCHRKYGEANAILVGDALLTLAFEVAGSDGLPNALAIVRALGQAGGTAGLVGGQVLDLQAISQPRTATEQTLTSISQRKTGALITASIVVGALAGKGASGQVRLLSAFGRDLGLAFQIVDDLHDRDGLARALGPEAARVQATELLRRATARLEPFGRRAAALSELAGWLRA